MPTNKPDRVLAVLGMHRSGTSCLTGSLQQGGLFLGKHHTWNEYNRKGNRENQDVVNLHEGIFKANGATWDHPFRNTGILDRFLQRPMKWQARHISRAVEILEEYSHEALWGFKDPRALFLLQGWLKLVPEIEFVGIFRHPMAVARSLNNRPALPISLEKGLEIWFAYNSKLLEQLEKRSFPLFCFDWHEEEFHEKLNILHRDLDLKPLPEGERFYTSDLHNVKIENEIDLPDQVEQLYKKLVTHQYNP